MAVNLRREYPFFRGEQLAKTLLERYLKESHLGPPRSLEFNLGFEAGMLNACIGFKKNVSKENTYPPGSTAYDAFDHGWANAEGYFIFCNL